MWIVLFTYVIAFLFLFSLYFCVHYLEKRSWVLAGRWIPDREAVISVSGSFVCVRSVFLEVNFVKTRSVSGIVKIEHIFQEFGSDKNHWLAWTHKNNKKSLDRDFLLCFCNFCHFYTFSQFFTLFTPVVTSMKPQAHIISIAAFLASVHALDRAACPGGSATCRYRDTVEVTEEPYKIALLNCCENDSKMT